MWIMLITKLMTEVSPPKMSIHWAVPWPDDHYAREQQEIVEFVKDRRRKEKVLGWSDDIGWGQVFGADNPETASFYTILGQEPNWIGAVKIHYKGADVRVFPHEFTKQNAKNMRYYVIEEQVYELVESEVAVTSVRKLKMDPEQKAIYDAALMDGCTEQQATLVMLGFDITDDEIEFPPMGWYRLQREYANIFCDERELAE